ncbi:MAG: adenylate/guanylate cyclase domain-containing protein [Oscillatoria sp. PMC 1051.18]|nr:adenylate/guanylate cyclase domain-containing protein [Oscillatoria sp. PMC 1050.18]MEC5029066.1 adenylate/guanylate cyclase domain-containing protein [Oscillatoria sp. PMC 1051.18]
MRYLISAPDTPEEGRHELKIGVNTIGRAPDNSIVVMHGSISRHHAEINLTESRCTIQDLQSSNHTFVNEVKIDRWDLKDGDLIRCGNVIFKFVTLPLSAVNNREEEEIPATIVRQFTPEPTSVMMQDLLDEGQIAGSVLRIKQHNREQRSLDKLQILLEVSKELSSPETYDGLLFKILDLLLQIMNVDRAAILLVNETSKQLEAKAVKSRPGVTTDYQFYSKKITNTVLESGKAILTADATSDNRFSGSESILAQAIQASMCVPLKPRDRTIGVLYVDNLSVSNLYSDEDVEFLTALANQAAIAIDNAQLFQKMQAEAKLRGKLERFFPETISKKIKESENLAITEAEVTAVFSDISGYTKMSSQMRPRQVIEMLNQYFQIMVEDIVFPYEGTLEKYIGDALLAVWGVPYQRADDADRAVRAAIEMQRAVGRFNNSWMQQGNQPISIHIGINTGKAAAGNIGSKRLIQFATIGDTTNVASRVCSAAEADEIMISQSTFDKLKDKTIPLEKLPPVMVKGKDEPLQLYKVLWQQIKSVATNVS